MKPIPSVKLTRKALRRGDKPKSLASLNLKSCTDYPGITKLTKSFISLSLLSFLSVGVASETTNSPLPITPDKANPTFAPEIIKAHNDVPIVNITTPNPAGISNNAFRDFNVNRNGLIFNNIKDSPSKTELAGYINANPNLTNSSVAKLILNQITSENPSTLLGYMEIAGNKANLIIANPNGIDCVGCGFINTANATMIAGKLSQEFNDKFLMMKNMQEAMQSLKFAIKDGNITIGTFNGKNLQALNLISRTLRVNGKIDASKIAMILGQNNITIDPSNASVLLFQPVSLPDDSQEKKPALALDVAYMGGVYANSIYLVATDAGVGVKNSGTMATFPSRDGHDGGFVIHSNGDIEITKPTPLATEQDPTQKSIANIPSNTLTTTGADTAQPITLSATTPLIYAGTDLAITAPNVTNHSIIYGEKDISIATTGDINNIGEMELVPKMISQENYHHRTDGNKKYSEYNYTTTITQDELKAGSYHPAIIYAKNSLHLNATLINNKSSIIATPKGDLHTLSNLNNISPLPKRTEESVGTRMDYDRYGGSCGLKFIFGKQGWNCHSSTTYHSYHPAPKVSTLTIADLHIPEIPLEAMMGAYTHTLIDDYNTASHPYTIDSDPDYQTPRAFLQTKSFQSSVANSALLSAMMDKADTQNHLNAIQAVSSKPSIGMGITAHNAYLQNVPALSQASALYNTSAIHTDSLYLATANITNKNGLIVSDNDMDILAGSFVSDSGRLESGGNMVINAKDVSIKTGTTNNTFYFQPAMFSFLRPIFSTSQTFDTTATLKAHHLQINATDTLSLAGADIEVAKDMDLKAKNIKITTATAKKHYSDHALTRTDSTQQRSLLHAGGNINLEGGENLDFTSIKARADNKIAFYANNDLTLDTATKDTYNKLTTYSSDNKFFSSTTTTTTTETATSSHLANKLEAKDISLASGGNTTAYNLSADSQDFSISAKGNAKISNHADTASETIHQEIKTTGLYMGASNGKVSLSVGTDNTKSDTYANQATHHNQTIQADHIAIVSSNADIAIESSNLKTGPNGSIALSGNDVSIASLENTTSKTSHTETKSNRIGIQIAVPTDFFTTDTKTLLKTSLTDLGKSLVDKGKKSDKYRDISNLADGFITGRTFQDFADDMQGSLENPRISLGITHTTTTSNSSEKANFASSSNISAGDLQIVARNNAKVIGSNITAQSASIEAKNLDILSAQNISDKTSHTNTQETSLTFSAKLDGAKTGLSGELAYQNTDSNTKTLSNTNTASNLNMGLLHINTAESVNITGSNLNTDTATIQTKSFNMQASEDKSYELKNSQSYGGSVEVAYNGGFDVGVGLNISGGSNQKNKTTHNKSTLNANQLTLIATEATNNTSSINVNELHSPTEIKQIKQEDTSKETSSSYAASTSLRVGASGVSGNIDFSIQPPDAGKYSLSMGTSSKPSKDSQSPKVAKSINTEYKGKYWQASSNNVIDTIKGGIDLGKNIKTEYSSNHSPKDKAKAITKDSLNYASQAYKNFTTDETKNKVNDIIFGNDKSKK
ncbi:hemagglutinin repeat-containing protein [Helicobacter sp. 11S02596-1]|uniref:two-partner secretion domain-containing protein n=1 Tax=Helicobacter sp. 11S02596-1 TaxID=1476194 RepID=UPI000BA62341|nr:hemagglutinin repeat-containing protein [Helicobacter sp. 11S02596-1]PAF42089.1 hypothetical protein BJI48_07190 [Helicobacter sp. 11S02596-1]